ncbi:uncharacterized protein METZ01_LOCUS355412 [marine metagenome]|jgi:hypothetical protein|uniref:Uncharacterized protein n=1 Tax=marine metagenome TaxID=408172 RepID=A0A382S058_9ZZZZ
MTALEAIDVSTVNVGVFEKVALAFETTLKPVHRLTSSADLSVTVTVIQPVTAPI